MALRSHLLNLGICLFAAASAEAAIRCYPLDARAVYAIRISREAPTTCVFPAALTAIEGAGVSTKAEDNPAVLLSHQAGAGFFTLRALQENAAAAMNVVLNGKVYALSFSSGSDPDRTVVFTDQAGKKDDAVDYGALTQRAKADSRFPVGSGRLDLERTETQLITRYPHFLVRIIEVVRFEAEDALIFRCSLENAGDQPVRYEAAGIAVRVGYDVYPATVADASGAIPARGKAEAWLAIAGNSSGGRAELSVHEAFSILVPVSAAP